MATFTLTIPSSQFASTTITVADGDVVNIPAGMRGSITINGGPNVTVNVLGDPDSGSTFGQLQLGGFGSDIEPTVNIPAGTDFSRYPINANGENLTLNVGDGATLNSIDATGMSNTGTLTINAGDDVTIDGSIDNYGADAVFDFGSGATVTGTCRDNNRIWGSQTRPSLMNPGTTTKGCANNCAGSIIYICPYFMRLSVALGFTTRPKVRGSKDFFILQKIG